MQTVALFALLMPTLTVAAAPVVQQDPPLQIWLSNNDHLEFDEKIRVYVRTEADGHLMVLHADPEGRVRVLFPLDPFSDDFIRGGRDFEIRDLENHDAIRTVDEVGYGTVYVAFSEDPFRYGEFSRGDHWDYRVFDEYEITGDAEGALTQIAQRMAVGSSFVFDTDTYYLSPPSAYTRAYRNYRPSYYGRHDHYGIGIRIGFNFGGPRYYGWPSNRYRYGYWASYWYDPFFYDPFYYDPFYFGYGYGYGYGGYYGSNYYYGRNIFYGPGYYTTSGVRTNRNYTTRNRQPVPASNYRDRRLAPSGILASGASRRASPARPRPVRASSAVSRRTPTTRPAPSTRATSSPIPMPPARSLAHDSVIGIGQNRPSAHFMSRQQPRQSAAPMNPVSGVYAPIASISRSETSRLDIGTFRNRSARCNPSARSASGWTGKSAAPTTWPRSRRRSRLSARRAPTSRSSSAPRPSSIGATWCRRRSSGRAARSSISACRSIRAT